MIATITPPTSSNSPIFWLIKRTPIAQSSLPTKPSKRTANEPQTKKIHRSWCLRRILWCYRVDLGGIGSIRIFVGTARAPVRGTPGRCHAAFVLPRLAEFRQRLVVLTPEMSRGLEAIQRPVIADDDRLGVEAKPRGVGRPDERMAQISIHLARPSKSDRPPSANGLTPKSADSLRP
jgi:hypothetical protein